MPFQPALAQQLRSIDPGYTGCVRDERRLARRAARGDRDAFTTIFRGFQQDLYRYCVAILGDSEDAQDALQNTMVKALGALPGERREIDLKPWLYRIAHNESIDLIRRRRQTVSLEDDGLPASAGLVEEVEMRHRLRQLLADVAELPERQRGALLMREAGGLEFEEIAAALGTSPAVARQTLYEARLGLREMDAGRNMECTVVTAALSDGDRRSRRRRDVSAHLKACPECRLFAEEIDSRRRALASISPLPALAAAALLQGLGGSGTSGAALGSGTAAASGTSAGAGVAAAGKAIGTATLLKGAATIAAVAAIGVGGADVGGVLPGAGHDGPTKAHAPAPGKEAPDRGNESQPQGAALESRGPGIPDPASFDRPGSDRLRQGNEPPRVPPTPPSSATTADRTAGPAASGQPALTPVPGPGDETTTRATPGSSAVEHPRGHDHPKQLPASAAHGQETATADKGGGKSASAPGHSGKSAGAPSPAAPTHPDHPAHPTHPAHPAHPDHPAHPAHPDHPAHPTHPDHPAKPAHPDPPEPPSPVPPATESATTTEAAPAEEEPPGAEAGPPGQTRTPPGQAKDEEA
jgi:RNA polymerase sigma factor (sigma-70 family)